MTGTITRVPLARPIIGAEERSEVDRVLASGMLAQGAEVASFEAEFSEYVSGRPCVAVNSGTSALLLALMAMGIGRGDEVILPGFTFAGTANAVVLAGATPVFVDIDPKHFCLDPRAVEAAITPCTAAVIPVHLYGHPADMDQLMAVAARHGLAVLEDAAQAHLAAWRSRPVGTFGEAAAFSFYPTKNMTTGEGGLVVCADTATARRVKVLRNQGMMGRYDHEFVGYNARMTDIGAAIGRVQLRRLPRWTSIRRENASRLSMELAAARIDSAVSLPQVADGADPVWHQYTVRVRGRDEVAAKLDEAGVGSAVHYPNALHQLALYRRFCRGRAPGLPMAERASRDVLSLPVHPLLSETDLSAVVAAVCRAVPN
ncbi:DegT/DnrJ/EryC1/StrS family aminotransferase [Saccharopolyspora mangrovi]|uniref:DegT/DnrJ/EryC1/StrS family aminotransferase n=1 Tax=Saccharopolyspora mangrovi TaxID=3082379 RepID=A0ABU6A4I3_9PSEU|nr:DegT/DnrJ/EryC1/StrS family aminotransferase [Saccharopolyspora sp. S2-29]MEB3366463.1 DegT/DnrJ/EryC1/StrS family aminotransferase [Saccharopolyspora sp. S2-29]